MRSPLAPDTAARRPAGDPRPPGSRRRPPLVVVVTVAVLAFGLGAGAVILLDDAEAGGYDPQPAARPAGQADAAGPVPQQPDPSATPPDPGVPATSPRQAVTLFLSAEVAGEWERSFALLAPPDRAVYSGTAGWVAAHGRMPTITGFEVEAVEGDRVTTRLRLESRLDPVLGLVPARMRAVWPTTDEGGEVLIRHGEAELTPLYPDRAGAAPVAQAWAEDMQACADPEVGHPGPRFGVLSLPEDLCGAAGDVRVGQPRALGSDAAFAGLVAAFGPPATDWAVGVPLLEPVEMEILLAPVDDRWVVLGAIAARGGGA